MLKIIFSLLLFVLAAAVPAFTQEDATLKELLRGKTKLNDIMQVVKTHYKNPETVNHLGQNTVNRNLKHWQRFEWYMSSRLGPDGEFVNINQKMQEATGLQQSRTAGSNNSSQIISSSTGVWSAIGPLNTDAGIGRADRLAFHPTDANTVFVGTTAGGLWRTTDAGTNWTNISPDIPSAGISGIVINPDHTDSIFILTGDGDSNMGGLVDDYGYMRLSIGVLLTTNGGTTWKKTGDFPGADYSALVGYRLVMHPQNNNILYACTNQGLYMSLNAGDSWFLSNGTGRWFNLEFRPGSNSVCYAVGSTNATGSTSSFSRALFWRSTNSGIISWDTSNVINNQINNPTRRVDLAVAPTNSNLVYLLAGGVPGNGPGNPVPNLFKGFFMSDDGGLTFTRQSNSPNIMGRSTAGTDTVQQSNYDIAVTVSNTTSQTVVTGGVQVWRSLDGGSNWVYRGDLHDDVHDLGFHPVGNKLWAATDGGVYSSTDNGANWTSHFQDMNTTQFYRMAVDPENYQNMIAGAQDNEVKRRTGATSFFDAIACCDGFAVGYDNFNPDTMFVVTNQSINRSYDGGNNFTGITPANSVNPFSMAMAVHTSSSNALFISSDSTWRTTNGGNSWTVIPNLSMGWFLRTCPSNGNRIYGAGGNAYNASPVPGSIRRSDDGGANWSANLNTGGNGLPFNLPQKITSINVDPNNSNNVWVTFGGFTDGEKVYSSNDAGGTWTNRSYDLPNVPVNCIALDINNNAYIGTDNGVYYRQSGTSHWLPFYNNLPYVPVTDLIITESENRIRAATFGRGIWSSDLYSTCVTDLNITGTLEGQEFHEASNNITSTASLLTSEGSKVQMRGGNEVLLQPGFTAREMTSFRAAIGPCGSGGVAGFFVPEINSSTKLPAKHFLPPPGGKRSMIHIHSVSNGIIQFEVNQKYNGETDVVITDEAGAIINTKNFASTQVGKWNNTISTTGLQPGLYYLNIMLDKRVEHMQEVIIR